MTIYVDFFETFGSGMGAFEEAGLLGRPLRVDGRGPNRARPRPSHLRRLHRARRHWAARGYGV